MPNIIAPLYRNGMPAYPSPIDGQAEVTRGDYALQLTACQMAELAWRVKRAEVSYDMSVNIDVGGVNYSYNYSNVFETSRTIGGNPSNNENDAVFGNPTLATSRAKPIFVTEDTRFQSEGITVSEGENTYYEDLTVSVSGSISGLGLTVPAIVTNGNNYCAETTITVSDTLLTYSTNPLDFFDPVEVGALNYGNASCPLYCDNLFDSGSVSANIVFLPIEFYTFGNTVSNTTGLPV